MPLFYLCLSNYAYFMLLSELLYAQIIDYMYTHTDSTFVIQGNWNAPFLY